ncbi:MAG: outer membrane protein assembly factor BamA [Desulfosarcina sp.]
MLKRFLTENRMGMGLVVIVLLNAFALQTDAAQGTPLQREAAMPAAGDATVAEVRVVVEAPPQRQKRDADLARRIIAIRTGDRLSGDAVETAINALKLSNRFSAIHVESLSEAGQTVLIFRLTPYPFVKDIRIRGHYPLFERDILNQMTLFPGNPLTQADLSDQVEGISKRYKREGFIDPLVTVTARHDPRDGNAVVHVTIDKGPHYRLGGLRFEGNRGLSDAALKWRMRTWRASLVPGIGRFSQYRLKKDGETLLEYYRRKGFADAALSFQTERPDEANRIDTTVRINEGRRYRIAFEGNQAFWDFTLKKDVTLFSGGNRGNAGVRRSIRNMRNRYRSAGYLAASIQTEVTDVPGKPADIRHLRFVIEEGPQSIVETVTIDGNRAMPEETIRKQLLTRRPALFHDGGFDPETLETDVYAVTTLYMKQGFQERKVEPNVSFSEDKTTVDVSLGIDEGPQTSVRSIVINGLKVLPESAARKRLIHQIGSPFRQTALEVEKEAITSLVAEKGYPHATVKSSVTFSDDRTQADIVHAVNPGPRVKMGKIVVSGNLRTREKVIRRELAVQPESPLSLRTLHDGQRRLRDLDIFHSVDYRTSGLKEKEETVNLFVEVEENKPYFAQISGGYESDSGFFGRTRIGDRNLFGLNKNLWAGGEISQTGYRVETRLTEPRFFGTRITASLGVFNEELTEFNQPFGTRTTGGSLGFGREWGKHITTTLSFSLEERDQFRVEGEPVSVVEEPTRTIFVTTPYLKYDSRDSFVRPTKGLFTSLGVDLSTGVQNDLDDFVRYLFDGRYFYTPVERFTLAGLIRVGHVWSYAGGDLVPDDQLFFLGGIRDVRGFKENLLRFDDIGDPVGGKTAIVGSLEARFDLGMNLELTTFFDIGSVKEAQVDQGTDRFRPSVGAGLRYITPIGPMGLLYGYKLDRLEGESAGRLHVSIGYSF